MLSESLPPGSYKVIVHAGTQEVAENVVLKADTDTVLKVVRRGNQFALDTKRGSQPELVWQLADVEDSDGEG